jgi:hypothetical protein
MKLDLGKAIFEALFNDENKDKMIDALNAKINIPIIGESAERKIIENVYEVVEEVLESMMLKKD